MSQYWRCPNCGATLKKGLSAEVLKKYEEQGKPIPGKATCGKCKSVYPQADVYGGKYDVNVVVKKPTAVIKAPAPTTPGTVAPAVNTAAASMLNPNVGATIDMAISPIARANLKVPDAIAFADAPMPMPAAAEPPAPAKSSSVAPSPSPATTATPASKSMGLQDFMADLDAGVNLVAPEGGTMVDYSMNEGSSAGPQAETVDDVPPPKTGFDEFLPNLGLGIHCDVCAKMLKKAEGMLLAVEEVLASEDFVDFLIERWSIAGWLPDGVDPEQLRPMVRQDITTQGGDAPWLVCDDCTYMFPHVRGPHLSEAIQQARGWWPADNKRPQATAQDEAPNRLGVDPTAPTLDLASADAMGDQDVVPDDDEKGLDQLDDLMFRSGEPRGRHDPEMDPAAGDVDLGDYDERR